jgi:membrane fusion protein (multidrug efflux system)
MVNKLLVQLFVVAGIVSFGGVLHAEDKKTPQSAVAPKVDAYTVKVQSNMPISLEYPARLKNIRSAVVVSRVTGLLMKKNYEEGAFVTKGQLLYEIEPDIYAATVKEYEADVELKESIFTKSKLDWARAEALFKDKALSKQEYDSTLSEYQTAKAGVTAAKAKLASANVNLSYTQVKAPISGIAGIKMTDLGNVVAPGTELVKITQSNPIYAEFSIPDVERLKGIYAMQNGDWSKIAKDGLSATLKVGDFTANGKIDYIDTGVDNKTGSVKARAVFDNPSLALMEGAYGRVVVGGFVRSSVMMIPQKAVLQNPLGTIVFTIKDAKVTPTPVKVGDTIGDNFVVSGLKEGDVVIVNNFFHIKADMTVTIDKMINIEGK